VDRSNILVLVLYNDDRQTTHGSARDLIAVQYTTKVAGQLLDALRARGWRAELLPVYKSLDELAARLEKYQPASTFIFNNCDSFGGDNKSATLPIARIETLGYAHTGSTAATNALCIDKKNAGERLRAAGLITPPSQIFESPDGDLTFGYPAIVKPVNEDASMGIDLESVVRTPTALRDRLTYVIERYQQPALVEKFIIGRELAVSLWGNDPVEALPVAEQDFSAIGDPLEHLLTYDSKWVEDSYYYKNIPSLVPAPLAPEEHATLTDAAVRAFHALGMRDFGRVDFRLRDNVPYIIDINEIPDLDYESGFARATRAAGFEYSEMVERLLTLALTREGWL